MEEKAQKIADELWNEFDNVPLKFSDHFLSDSSIKENCIITCNHIITVLNSVKGLGKIQKVKLYKLVLTKLQAK